MTQQFWNQFADRVAAVESAIVAEDVAALVNLTNELAETLVAENPLLNLNVGGRDPFYLSILSLPGAEPLAAKFVSNAPQIENWQILAEMPEYDPLESAHVTDDAGGSLEVRFDELDAKVLPPEDGRVAVVLSLDADFDPAGAKSHLYHAIAEHVIFTVLGGWPETLSKVVLLPRTRTGKLQPLDTLREQWLETVGPPSPA